MIPRSAKVLIPGCLSLAGFLGWTVLSYFLSPAFAARHLQTIKLDAFARLSNHFAFLGPKLQHAIAGQSVFADRSDFLIAYSIPVLLASAGFAWIFCTIARSNSLLPDLPKVIFRWAVVFALVASSAVPVITPDFWLSASWGRMIAQGSNPYYASLTPQIVGELPNDLLRQKMTYGPLWAVVSGLGMVIAGKSAWIAFLFFKSVLLAAWILSLRLILRIASNRSPRDQALALAIFGWLPVGVLQTLAEGHNDIVMIVFVLLWLALALEEKSGTIALALSAAVKYVTAVLIVLDVLDALRRRAIPFRQYLKSAAVAGAIGIALLALFFRDPSFFAATAVMQSWPQHYGMGDISKAIYLVSAIYPTGLRTILQLGFAAFAALALFRYWRNPDSADLPKTILAVLCSALFSVVGHVWPWYLLWIIAPAALSIGSSMLARWTIGLAFLAPIVTVGLEDFDSRLPTLAWYSMSLILVGILPKSLWASGSAREHGVPLNLAPSIPPHPHGITRSRASSSS